MTVPKLFYIILDNFFRELMTMFPNNKVTFGFSFLKTMPKCIF